MNKTKILVNNNYKGDDFIKALNKMMLLGAGVGAGLLYSKYKKNIGSMLKKKTKAMKDNMK